MNVRYMLLTRDEGQEGVKPRAIGDGPPPKPPLPPAISAYLHSAYGGRWKLVPAWLAEDAADAWTVYAPGADGKMECVGMIVYDNIEPDAATGAS